MEMVVALIFAFGLFYALGREHGARRDGKRVKAPRQSTRRDDWSPFDDFWSDR